MVVFNYHNVRQSVLIVDDIKNVIKTTRVLLMETSPITGTNYIVDIYLFHFPGRLHGDTMTEISQKK